MVNSVSRRGLNDWLVQRFSAVYMALCLAGLVFFLFSHPGLSYVEWHQLFVSLPIKVIALLFFLSMLLHAWIGMWTVFTDYITCGYLRICLQAIVLFSLGGFFFASVLILWSA